MGSVTNGVLNSTESVVSPPPVISLAGHRPFQLRFSAGGWRDGNRPCWPMDRGASPGKCARPQEAGLSLISMSRASYDPRGT
jgi:hypothetical protein